MVVGKPYIHFTVNNNPIEEVVDYNYTWATTVEANKGPVNVPVYISSADEAYSIFNIDMRPYFAQTPRSLIMVRVAASSNEREPSKGVFSFNTEKPIVMYRADQKEITLTHKEPSEGESDTQVDVSLTFKVYYVKTEDGTPIPVIEHRTQDGNLIPESYIDSWDNMGRIITKEMVDADTAKESEDDTKQGWTADDISNIYNANQVQPFLTPQRYIIGVTQEKVEERVETTVTPTALFTVTGEYEGDYGISISCSPSLTGDGYTIVITDPSLGTLRIQNAYDIQKIVNRINDKRINLVAESTTAGDAITKAMHSYAKYVEVKDVEINGESEKIILNNFTEGSFISLAVPKAEITPATGEYSYEDITYLTAEENKKIENDKANGTETATVKAIDYAINLASVGQQSLVGGSNGEWDENLNRIPQKYQGEAHAAGLKLLQRIRIAGVFCMYGEDAIQRAYVEHGINSQEPEKGMNNNETCKWRTILLGANSSDRTDLSSLSARAAALDNEYILLLGQGLIDTGMNGYASTLSVQEKKVLGLVSDHQLLPYECTQYIAGLRSKLNYGESIFGGQGRKRIRSVGDLEIAPLLDYETEYSWDPISYERLNESGVLTFTEDYGNITLTDGVTTIQTGEEEDEESVMNILKYCQNAVYDVCLPYIGRNIDSTLEISLQAAVESVLSNMRDIDKTLVDTDEYSAYDVTVSLGARQNQLLGRIQLLIYITPVHALRQIEVEMTVQ